MFLVKICRKRVLTNIWKKKNAKNINMLTKNLKYLCKLNNNFCNPLQCTFLNLLASFLSTQSLDCKNSLFAPDTIFETSPLQWELLLGAKSLTRQCSETICAKFFQHAICDPSTQDTKSGILRNAIRIVCALVQICLGTHLHFQSDKCTHVPREREIKSTPRASWLSLYHRVRQFCNSLATVVCIFSLAALWAQET